MLPNYKSSTIVRVSMDPDGSWRGHNITNGREVVTLGKKTRQLAIKEILKDVTKILESDNWESLTAKTVPTEKRPES